MSDLSYQNNPSHVAIIMDGNGRWAEHRGLARAIGHMEGAKRAKDVIKMTMNFNIRFLTLYLFSNENWQRPQAEIDFIFQILENYLKEESKNLLKEKIKVLVMGDLKKIPEPCRLLLEDLIAKSHNNNKLTLVLALSYGSKQEVARACKLSCDNQKSIYENFYLPSLPDPDLLIRVGKERRLSNFMLMQLSYSEIYFCPVLWPDFTFKDFERALGDFKNRIRKRGQVLA